MDAIFAAPSVANIATTGEVTPYDLAAIASPFVGTAIAGRFGRMVKEPSPEIPRLAAERAHRLSTRYPDKSYADSYNAWEKKLKADPRYQREYLQPNDILGMGADIGLTTTAGMMAARNPGQIQENTDDIYSRLYGI